MAATQPDRRDDDEPFDDRVVRAAMCEGAGALEVLAESMRWAAGRQPDDAEDLRWQAMRASHAAEVLRQAAERAGPVSTPLSSDHPRRRRRPPRASG